MNNNQRLLIEVKDWEGGTLLTKVIPVGSQPEVEDALRAVRRLALPLPEKVEPNDQDSNDHRD